MRKLNAVTCIHANNFDVLKKHALLFDKIYIFPDRIPFEIAPATVPQLSDWPADFFIPEEWRADFEYLKRLGIVDAVSLDLVAHLFEVRYYDEQKRDTNGRNDASYFDWRLWTEAREFYPHFVVSGWNRNGYGRVFGDVFARHLATKLENIQSVEIAPLCEIPLLDFGPNDRSNSTTLVDALAIGTDMLPTPPEDSPWELILDLKRDLAGRQWDFRRFLNDLATKRRSNAEIRDDLEWTVNEYSKALEIHKMKASSSFWQVFIISPLEIIENVVKLNLSTVAKGMLSARARKIDRMDFESKASGRECAYILETRERLRG